MKSLLFISLFFFGLRTQSQDIIYTISGDTLTGKISILPPEEFSESITFKISSGKLSFNATQIRGFNKAGIEYRVVKYDNKYQIMKVIENGYMSLLLFRSPGSTEFSLEYLQKIDGEGIEVPGILFKPSIEPFFKECKPAIGKLNDTKRKNLKELVKFYNSQCIQDLSR